MGANCGRLAGFLQGGRAMRTAIRSSWSVLPFLLAASCGGGSEQTREPEAPVIPADTEAVAEPEPEPPPPEPPPPPPSLFERLGGHVAVTGIVDDLVTRILADRRIKRFFRRTNRDDLEAGLVLHLCAATGGDCGEAPDTEAWPRLTDDQFDVVVDHFTASVDAAGVTEPARGEGVLAAGQLRARFVRP